MCKGYIYLHFLNLFLPYCALFQTGLQFGLWEFQQRKQGLLELCCHGTMPFTKTIVHKNLIKIEEQIMTSFDYIRAQQYVKCHKLNF